MITFLLRLPRDRNSQYAEFWYGRPKTDPGPKNDPELFDRGIFLGADPSHAGSLQVLTRSTNGYFTFYSKQGWLGPLRGPRLPR